MHFGKDDGDGHGDGPGRRAREDAAALVRMLQYIAMESAAIEAWESVSHVLLAEKCLSRMFNLSETELYGQTKRPDGPEDRTKVSSPSKPLPPGRFPGPGEASC